MNSENKIIKVYTCGIDFQHELGEVLDYVKVYSTIEDLKRQVKCWEQCGIVELEVSLSKWVEPQKLWESDT